MKAEIEADDLAEVVKHAASLAKGHGVTNCLRLEAKDGHLTVTGGDGDTFAEFTTKADVEDAGVALTPAKVFAKAVPKLNGSVELCVDDDGALGVETLNSRLTLPTVSDELYPKLRWPEGDPVDMTDCWDRLRLIAYASAMALEPVFQAVKLLPDGWAEAYDKTRMARTRIPEGLSASVRKDSFDFAAKVIEGSIHITTGDNAVAFLGKNVKVYAAVVQAEAVTAYPAEVDNLMAQGTQVSFDRKGLLEAIGLIEVVKDDERQAIRVDIADGEASLSGRAEIGEVHSAVPVEGGTPWPFGITGGYVKDVLTRTSEEQVTFQFGPSNRHPIVVESEGIFHLLGPNVKALA